MTKRQGMLWKTAWKRRGAYGSGTPKGVWFVDLRPDETSANEYVTAAAAPFAFQSVPFWIGWMWASGAADEYPRDSRIIQYDGTTRAQSGSLLAINSAYSNIGVNPVFDGDYVDVRADRYLPVWNAGSVIVSLAVVQQVGADLKLDLWMDGGLRESTTFAAAVYAVPTGVATIQYPGSGTVSQLAPNFAAGSGVPTEAQIEAWFAAVRNNARIQPIPGLTTDMFDAEVAAPGPIPPNPFPNGGGGQQWLVNNTEGNKPVLVLKDVVFNY